TANAALELSNTTVSGESLQLLGNGGNLAGFLDGVFSQANNIVFGSGALRAVSDSVLAGPIELRSNDTGGGGVRFASVRANSDSTLTLSGIISQANNTNHFVKVGAGRVELTGVGSNSYAGNTYITAGELTLNKPGTDVALANGEIFIGDNVGGADA